MSATGNDANDGSSWCLAKKTVQAGINAASAAGGDVWVAAGTYNEQVTLTDYAYLYGGFAGTESAADQRNFSANSTILDGGGGESVVVMEVGNKASGVDGFTIRNGNADYFGAIVCYCSSPTVSNNIVTGNKESGIWCSNSSATISNNIITGNSEDPTYSGVGGGIYCWSSSPTISNNTITGNSAVDGGGIECDGPAIISNNIITGNSANAGAGIECDWCSAIISNNIIAGNNAGSSGVGGGIYCCDDSSTPISNNTITANSAYEGGGIYCDDSSSPPVSNNVVSFNSSGLDSGGGSPVMRNNCVYNPDGANYSGLSAGTGDIQVDPKFVSLTTGDYHLTAGSPCINAGWNAAPGIGSVDMDGNPRILPAGGTVDIGCYEYLAQMSGSGQAKAGSQQVAVKLAGKPVTAVFAGEFYIEDTDRCGGIKVVSSQAVNPGDLVTITGNTAPDNGECALYPASISVTPGAPSNVPGALLLTNRCIGGGAFFWNANGNVCGQEGDHGWVRLEQHRSSGSGLRDICLCRQPNVHPR